MSGEVIAGMAEVDSGLWEGGACQISVPSATGFTVEVVSVTLGGEILVWGVLVDGVSGVGRVLGVTIYNSEKELVITT